MKKIEAIIRSSKFEDVKEALEAIGIRFFTFFEVKGHGLEKEDEIKYRGAIYDSGYIPRQKLEIVVQESDIQPVVEAIQKHAYTGQIGDGKIIVTHIEAFLRIRTGETSEAALS